MNICIVTAGDREWQCDELAKVVVNRLIARYGPVVVIVHGNEPGVDNSIATAAKDLGATAEARVIDRKQTGHPTIGARNCELFLGGADMCLAIHAARLLLFEDT